MTRSAAAVCAVLLSAAAVTGPEAQADPDVRGGARGDTFYVAVVDQTKGGASSLAIDADSAENTPLNPIVEYRWLIVCADVGSGSPGVANAVDCNAARVCDRPADRLYRLWGRTEDPAGWQTVATRCFGEPPTAADTPTPQVTPGLVLSELRRVGLPPLTVRIQPEGTTLVNLPTVFYTEPVPVRTTLTLLGQGVEVEATATEYTWHHGDGTTAVTDGPGAPYPAMEVTHTYTDARVTVQPRVDVAYSARFRVDGGSWQDIGETVSMSGPATDLRVAEATALLSGDYR